MIIISHFQARELLDAFDRKRTSVKVSSDLGISEEEVMILQDKFVFSNEISVDLKEIEKIAENENVCFFVENGEAKKIQTYSPETKKFYKLFPAGIDTPPAVEISGIRMHNVKDTNPLKDAKDKIAAVSPVNGIVLDTCMGGGYTAILAGKKAEVYTFEVDKTILEIAKYNPWSKELFENKNIVLKNENIIAAIKKFKNGFFDRIIHDPPSFKICPELYTQEFYNELFRVLKPTGRMYHYIGKPGSKKGVNIEKGVVKRLRIVGFDFIRKAANGVVVGK